MNFSIDMFL